MSHFLGRRVLFSVVVLVMVIAALKLGLITANQSPLPTTVHIQKQTNIAKQHQQNASTTPQLETRSAYFL